MEGRKSRFFFLFNLFIGFLSFYNYTRELRANCVMGLAIFYLIYLFFKVIAILFPLLCGSQLIADKDHKIISALSGEDVVHSINENENENDNDNRNKNPLANSTDKLKSSQNHNNDIDEEKLDGSNHEENKYPENNSYNDNNNENNENSRQFEAEQNKKKKKKKEGINQDEI